MPIKITHIRLSTGGLKPEHISRLRTENQDSNSSGFTRQEMYDKIRSGRYYSVNISPYPRLVTAISSTGTRYVKSKGDGTPSDNLMKLPRF